MKLRTWLQGAGVAALILFPFYRTLLDMSAEVRMHTPISSRAIALTLIANLVLASFVFTFLGMWLRHLSKWTWLRLFVPALVISWLFEVVHIARAGWISTDLWVVSFLVILCLGFVLRGFWPPGEKLLVRFSGGVQIGLGFFCIFALLQLVHAAFWHQLPNATHQTLTTTGRSDRPRLVWILFDELSYQQTFGNRYASLQLPNFDEFRKSSTLFTDVQPVINETEKAVPSMLLGQPIVRVDYPTDNRLQVGRAAGAMFPFNSGATPFALAHQYGLTTGVVGWTNPYCGMLAPYLTDCYWTNEYEDPTLSTEESLWQDLLYPWKLYGNILRHPGQLSTHNGRTKLIGYLMEPSPGLYTQRRIYIYEDLMRHADRMLQQFAPDFVFLHLPLPHPPGFYNRKTKQFDTSGNRSYIDNLALADKTLGQLLTILKQSPRWKDTNVVICGDHSWRVYGWKGEPTWTPEAEAASHGGVFDPRPVLMVHLAGQTTQETVTAPFPLLRVHDILDDLIEGRQPAYASLQKAESLAGQ